MVAFRWLVAPVLALSALLAAPAPSHAAPAPELRGVFSYLPGESEDVDKAIAAVAQEMNFLVRGIAQGRLQKTNVPYGRIAIVGTPKEVSITTDARQPIVTVPNGTPIQWKREDGQLLDVSTRWKGAGLEQTFAAEDGRRVNLYSASPDGRRLWMEVTVTSQKLPKALTYKIAYKREK